MKTMHNLRYWLGLALACGIITSASSVKAKKPPKPPPEPPPPEGPAYRMVPLEGDVRPIAISDAGTVVGQAMFYTGEGSWYVAPFSLTSRVVVVDGSPPDYLVEDLQWLKADDGTIAYGGCFGVNNAGVAIGYVQHFAPEQALLWKIDGTPIDLRVSPSDIAAVGVDINDAGMVLVGIGYAGAPWPGGGVVVPLDMDGDPEQAPDTWFIDGDNDGINDLFFPIEIGNTITPLAMNEAGEIAIKEGYLLIPDVDDADGDGNPWFADEDPEDGFNDLLVELVAPEPGESVEISGLNGLGQVQVVGRSQGHLVLWEIADGVQVVTDLGVLSKKVKTMYPAGINDAGWMVGGSRMKSGFVGPSWLFQDGALHELLPLVVNAEGVSSLAPTGINNHGWICGDGFVATPVEEP